MAKQLDDILKSFRRMSDQERVDMITDIRRRKYTEKPAAKKRAERSAKTTSKKTLSAVEKKLSNMTPEQKAALLKELMKNG